jgi:hypothetical protein
LKRQAWIGSGYADSLVGTKGISLVQVGDVIQSTSSVDVGAVNAVGMPGGYIDVSINIYRVSSTSLPYS